MKLVEEELTREQSVWEQRRTNTKDKERRDIVKNLGSLNTRSMKRIEDIREKKGAPPKRMRYGLLEEDWGEAPTTITGELSPPPAPPLKSGSQAMEQSMVGQEAGAACTICTVYQPSPPP